ncbi:MAG: AI-2E family transporter [Elusimicrobiaceae bacterium]|nr:AI-2E family transporter [Elusimicrobiaceae bacterium]
MSTDRPVYFQKKIWKRTELIIPGITVLGLLVLLISVRGAAFPFVISIAVAYLLNPVVEFFESRGIKRVYAVSGIYLFFGLLCIVAMAVLVPFINAQAAIIANSWPEYMAKMQQLIIELQEKIYRSTPILRQFGDWKTLFAKISVLLERLPGFFISLVPMLTTLLLVPLIAFFFLLDGPFMIDALKNLIPAKYVEIVAHITNEIDESLGNYLRGIMLEAMILFVLALAGLFFMEINYAVPIAIIMGVSCLVPYVGPVVGGLLGAIAAFLQFGSLIMVLKVLLFFVALRFIDDWFLQPLILERAVKVHPAIIIFAIMSGAEMFGIWGVIFAMPVTCIAKVLISIAFELQRTEFAWKPKPEPTRVSIPYL